MKRSVFIFDVDGVLNNLQVYQADERIIRHIAALLSDRKFVAINTGRGYAWIEKNIIQPLRHELGKTDALNQLFVAVEMGGLGIEFRNGKERKTRSAFSLSQDQIGLVRSTFEAHSEYANMLHWYGKESMATLDKAVGASMEVFRPVQRALTTILQAVFKDQHVMVTNSNDAIDIHAPEAGKWAGAQLIYEWLSRSTDIHHDHFICFGDSMVDYQMARFFAEQSHDTVFVFTGENFDVDNGYENITVIKTDLPYNEGTYSYLKNL